MATPGVLTDEHGAVPGLWVTSGDGESSPDTIMTSGAGSECLAFRVTSLGVAKPPGL